MNRWPRAFGLALALAASAFAAPGRTQDLAAEKADAEKMAADAQAAAEMCAALRDRLSDHTRTDEPARVSPMPEAVAFDAQGKGPEATLAYAVAACARNCRAAKRLGEIHSKGLIGMPVNHAESRKWYSLARVNGCDAPIKAPVVTAASSPAFKAAVALESDGEPQQALNAYRKAAYANDCEAARRLGDIYSMGVAGIPRDYAESLKWYNKARALGCNIPMTNK